MEQVKRLNYVDVCKALGIILVIIGHTYYGPEVLYNLIYCFHMPLFFIISGFTFNKSRAIQMGFLPFAKKKAKELLIPYIFFAFVNLLLQIAWKFLLLKELISFSYIIENIAGILFCYSSMQYMPNCSPIWFLLCLFIADLIFFFVIKIDGKLAFVIAIICMLSSYLVGPLVQEYNKYPWKFPVFLMAVFLMYIGYNLRRFIFDRETTKKIPADIICIMLIVVSFAIEIVSGNSVGMNENQYGNIMIFLLTSIVIPESILMLCKNLPILSNSKIVMWIGRNTIYVVGFNYFCRDVATEIYYMIPILGRHRISFLPLFFITFLLCLLTIFVCTHANNALLSLTNKTQN